MDAFPDFVSPDGFRKKREKEIKAEDDLAEGEIRALITKRIDSELLTNLAYIQIKIPQYYPHRNQIKVLTELIHLFPGGVGTFKGDVGDAVFEPILASTLTRGVAEFYLLPQLDVPLATAHYNSPPCVQLSFNVT